MNKHINIEVYFLEEQQFRQRWVWILLLLTTLFVTILFAYGMFKQFTLRQPWGNRPMSDVSLAIIGSISILFMGGLTYLFYKLKLITEVRNDGLYIRFLPFSQQIILFDNIIEVYSERKAALEHSFFIAP